MSGRTSRNYLLVASAIVIAAALVSASLFVAIGGAKTSTVTSTSTSTSTTTATETSIQTSTSSVTQTESVTLTSTSFSTMTATLTFTSAVSQTESVVTASGGGCPAGMVCASYAFSPLGDVRVDSVLATQPATEYGGAESGQQVVGFYVTIENVGDETVYIPGGSTGVSTIVPSDSTVLQKFSSETCAGTFSIVELAPNQNLTLYGPSCETGYEYQFVKSGSVSVGLGFSWAESSNPSVYPSEFPNSTVISADFVFP